MEKTTNTPLTDIYDLEAFLQKSYRAEIRLFLSLDFGPPYILEDRLLDKEAKGALSKSVTVILKKRIERLSEETRS